MYSTYLEVVGQLGPTAVLLPRGVHGDKDGGVEVDVDGKFDGKIGAKINGLGLLYTMSCKSTFLPGLLPLTCKSFSIIASTLRSDFDMIGV